MLLKLQQTGGVVCCVFLSQLLVEREKERITKVLCIQIEAKEDSTEINQEREKRSGRAQRLAQSEASQILIIDSSRGRGWRLYSCPMPSRTCPHLPTVHNIDATSRSSRPGSTLRTIPNIARPSASSAHKLSRTCHMCRCTLREGRRTARDIRQAAASRRVIRRLCRGSVRERRGG